MGREGDGLGVALPSNTVCLKTKANGISWPSRHVSLCISVQARLHRTAEDLWL